MSLSANELAINGQAGATYCGDGDGVNATTQGCGHAARWTHGDASLARVPYRSAHS